MDDKNQRETVNGYEILRAVTFEDNRGFALAECLTAPDPFVTWQFTEDENGARDYYWGHNCTSADTATRDYENRIDAYSHLNGVSEKDAYKYYLTQRPVDIGTFPKTENGPVRFENFDKRSEVEQGQFMAWGYCVYDAPLTEKQADDYELRAAPGNPGEKTPVRDKTQTAPKPIMEQLAEAAKKVERGDPAIADKKQNRDER